MRDHHLTVKFGIYASTITTLNPIMLLVCAISYELIMALKLLDSVKRSYQVTLYRDIWLSTKSVKMKCDQVNINSYIYRYVSVLFYYVAYKRNRYYTSEVHSYTVGI